MKATLEFNMDEPEDVMAHLRCAKSLDMALALWDISQAGYKDLSLEDYKSEVLQAFNKYNINLDDLIE